MYNGTGWVRGGLTAAALAILGACAPTIWDEPDLVGPQLEAFYAGAAVQIRAEGGLRTERDPRDAPVSRADLVRNFNRIAFFSEFGDVNGREVAGRSAITLTRWEKPAIDLGIIFGDSVSAEQQRKDIADVRALLVRFRAATGLNIRYRDSGEIDFFVMVLERGEQLGLAAAIEAGGNLPMSFAADLRNTRPSVFCSARLYSTDDLREGIAGAFALIKSEHRAVMRTSCFHEELTQALGLLNDDFRVRPSIFNDDEEFALLTRHDEALLAMLYDPRLQTGMSQAEARPVLDAVARDAARRVGLTLVP